MWNCKFYDSWSAIIIIDVDTGWSANGSVITPALTDWSINWCWPLTQSSLGTLLFLWTHCSFDEFLRIFPHTPGTPVTQKRSNLSARWRNSLLWWHHLYFIAISTRSFTLIFYNFPNSGRMCPTVPNWLVPKRNVYKEPNWNLLNSNSGKDNRI